MDIDHYRRLPLCCHSLSILTLSCDLQVILRNDVSECEEVLKALEEDPEKVMKLKEMNEEGLTLIHCAVMCDKHCAVRCDRHDTSEECTKLLWLKRLLEMGAGRPKSDELFSQDITKARLNFYVVVIKLCVWFEVRTSLYSRTHVYIWYTLSVYSTAGMSM